MFWPVRGPQWDALGRAAKGDIVLVEAKAHVEEICCPPTQASAKSLAQIEDALKQTADALGAAPRAPWTSAFYQYANRLAHLYFLRRNGMPAWLVFLYLLGDEDMGGPKSIEAWRCALQVMKYTMGLPRQHLLSEYVVDVFLNVATLASPSGPGSAAIHTA